MWISAQIHLSDIVMKCLESSLEDSDSLRNTKVTHVYIFSFSKTLIDKLNLDLESKLFSKLIALFLSSLKFSILLCSTMRASRFLLVTSY